MKKKFVIAVLSLVCALMCALGLAACSTRNDNPPVHTHDYAWTDNGDGTHNGHCSVSGCDKPNISNESHIWDTDNKCKKCKAVKPNDEHEHTYTDKWTSAGAEGHYHIATCEHKDEHTDIVPHVYDNETDTICNYCGYVREVVIPHTHNLIPTEANAATCTSDGNIAYWYCADCGNYYSDENGNTEITLADTVIDKLNHDIEHHDGQAATCTEDGWSAYDTCKRDGCNYTTYSVITKLGHDIEHVAKQNPTCVSVGWDAYDYCKRKDCGYTTKVEKPATGIHTGGTATCTAKAVCEVCHNEYGEIDANNHDIEHHNGQVATCTADGWNEYDACTRVGCKYTTKTTIPKLGHNFSNEFTTDKEPTCTEEGSKSKHCSRCEATTEETAIPANGHSWNNGEVTTEPNCTEAGVRTYTCSVCQDTRTEEIAALGHDYATEFTTDKEPTCTEAGSKSKHCSRCEATTEVTVIPANGHGWNNGEVTKESNCTETGVKTYTCSVCQATKTEEIAALGHDYATEFTTDKDPTCTENGSKSKHCSRCEATTEVTVIPANGHSWNNGEVTKEPNCTETGVKTYTCSICQDTRAEEIAAHGHTKGEAQQTVNPTCTEQGYTVYTCEVCNNEFNADYLPALGHSYNSEWICIRCGHEYATDGLVYELSQDGTHYTVVGYTGNSVQVVIPAHYNDIPVIAVGAKAFNGNTNISSVFLSKSIETVGGSAFRGCSGLTSITLPFVGANKDGTENTHFGYIFGASSAQGTFNSSSGVYLNGNQRSVPSSLKTVIITGGTSIEKSAFYACSGLTSIKIPESITSIEKTAFAACSGLTSITVDENNSNYASQGGILYNKAKTEFIHIPQAIKGAVMIPNGVTSIGVNAFAACSGLTSITIPNSVTSIGEGAFAYCSSLTSITIPYVGASKDGTSNTHFGYIFGASSYSDNSQYIPSSLKTVIITGGESIGFQAFYGCDSLESITLPFVGASKDGTSNTHFGYIFGASSYSSNAQYLPSSLKLVIITGGESIGNQAFYNCSGLTSITIPNSVTSIGYRAFYDCRTLTSITIPNSVTSIGSDAFYNCRTLASITIPNSVTSIGSGAFYNCSEFTSITIPNSVTNIGSGAFSGCGLVSVTIPFVGASKDGAENTHFGYIFGANSYLYNSDYVSKSLRTVIITGGASIGANAFYGCSGLTSVTIPNSVTSIGGSAFSGCSSLRYNEYVNALYLGNDTNKHVALIKAKNTSITYCTISENTKIIYSSAFSGCSSLSSISIPNGVTSIGGSVFSGCNSLSSITIPDSVTSIGNSVFNGCSRLTSVTIGNSVTSIGNQMFSGCSWLAHITIGNSVTSIGSNAFSDCSNLTSITIPDSVTSIGSGAFSYCSGLMIITIPDSITSIGSNAFYGCSGLTSITVDENNSNYASQDGILYNKAKTEFIHIPQAIKGVVSIPNGVTSIGVGAFSNCSSLTSITVPDSVTGIGISAFYGCSRLTSITLPFVGASKDGTSNTYFGYIFGASSYSYNSQYIPSSLKTVIITGGESIGFQAFYGCDSLESITLPFVGASKDGTSNTHFGYIFGASSYSSNAQYLPSSLKLVIITGGESIGHRAFYGCSGLASITIPDSVMSIGDNAFSGCSSLTSITIHNGVTSIGSGAFSGCSSLTSITIPNSVTSIWVGAFSGCSSLTSITIHNGVTSIGSNAFSGCSSLTSITIPNSVTSIGVGAFSNCSSLTSIMFKGTQAQWNAITKGSSWNYNTGDYTIHCADGDISKS